MRSLLKGKFKLFREQKGFTLIEVIIAVAILGAISVAFIAALDTNYRATRTLDEQVVATNLATVYFEAIIGSSLFTDYSAITGNITTPAHYSVDYTIYFSDDGYDWDPTYSDQTLQKITVFVSHQGKPVLSTCTYKTEK